MSASDANQPVGAGTVLCSRYRLVRLVAHGGMASVWEAHDHVLARSVAVKLLHPHLAADRTFLERFRQEAVSAARLAHPNVVATYDAGIAADGTAFIVMELIRGRTLSAFAAEHRPVPILVCVETGMQIAEALAHAHGAGLIHRDIKPANVLVCDSESDGVPLVKVTDFGIAKATEGLGLELTKTGMILGTPKYLSPEQIQGHDPDARADLYALGVVLFELVAGTPPFRGTTEMAVALQHVNEAPVRLRSLRPTTPPALDSLVAAMLAKRPEDRPRSANAVRQALAAIDADSRQPRSRPSNQGFDPTPHGAAAPPATGSSGSSRGGPPAGSSRPSTPVGPLGPPGWSAPPAAPRYGGGNGGGSSPTPPDGRRAPSRASGSPPLAAPSAAYARTGVVPHSTAANPRGAMPPPPRPSYAPTVAGPGATAWRGMGPTPRAAPPIRGRSPVRPSRQKRPNWAGRLVAALVVAALIVVLLVLASHGSGGGNPTAPPAGATATTPIKIVAAAVFHLERDADDSANAGFAIDGDPGTSWQTDHYFGPHFGNLRNGLGLALTMGSSHALHSLTVTSSTVGWSAEIYVADAVPDPPALAPWGPLVASKQDIDGSTTFDLNGQRGSDILLWITDLGPSNQASVAEVTAR